VKGSIYCQQMNFCLNRVVLGDQHDTHNFVGFRVSYRPRFQPFSIMDVFGIGLFTPKPFRQGLENTCHRLRAMSGLSCREPGDSHDCFLKNYVLWVQK